MMFNEPVVEPGASHVPMHIFAFQKLLAAVFS